MPELRGILRRSQRARNRHLSHAPEPSVDSAPHAHVAPLRHPFNLRPMLITSRQGSLAFRKVRSAKNVAPPGYHRFRETPRVLYGLPLISFHWARGSPVIFKLCCYLSRG